VTEDNVTPLFAKNKPATVDDVREVCQNEVVAILRHVLEVAERGGVLSLGICALGENSHFIRYGGVVSPDLIGCVELLKTQAAFAYATILAENARR
jgi:hypothetical protein